MNCPQAPLLEFVRAELDGETTEQVLRHLEACPECRQRLRVIAGLEAFYREKRARRKASKLWLLAAGVLAVIALPVLYSSWEGLRRGRADLAALATRETYPYFPLHTRSGQAAAEAPSIRESAFAAYNERDFRTAEREFSRIPADAEILFYRGVACYFLGLHDEALENWERALQSDSRWREPVLWYRANVFLKSGEAQSARDLLATLAREPGEFQQRAGALLEQLNWSMTHGP